MDNESVKITPLDERTCYGQSQLIKALIPYLDPSMGQKLAMFARIMEMQTTIDFFNNPNTLEACGVGNKKMEPEELLKDIQQYVSGAEAETLDQILKFLNISKIYDKFNHLDNPSDIGQMMAEMNPEFGRIDNNKGDLVNNLKAMLSPEQMQMFEALNAMNKQS